MKECKYYCEGYYSDDIGYEETDKINACGLTQTGYHEMSYKKCSDITNCYYKQLLAEQARVKQLEDIILGKFDAKQLLRIKGYNVTALMYEAEQAKNKKLVEAIFEAKDLLFNERDMLKAWEVLQQALNEVNNAK